jgi:5-formyltetrahydrofolate cyclo-ligase
MADDRPALRRRKLRFASGEAGGDSATISPLWLDLVLVPRVSSDARGHRLGLGAGICDRHFACPRRRRAWHRPLLRGVACEVRRIEQFVAAARDVPPWGVVTERGIYGRAAALLGASAAS